jgi:dihydroorotate dehydrogenase electron transfer subunit
LKHVLASIVFNEEVTKGTAQVPQTNYICLEAPEIAARAVPGQFVMIKCGHNAMLRRPLSIHQIDPSGQIYFLFISTGKGTNWLSRRQKGDKLDIIGPLGNGFSIKKTSTKLLLIGGGIGISPMAFLADKALYQGKKVSLILGARTKDQLYKQNLPISKMDAIFLTDDGSDGIKGTISDCPSLPAYINQADQIFACGPLPMYYALSDLINQSSLPGNVQISLETRMGCGFGICYGCSIKTRNGMKTVCHDGPVFNMEDIIWPEVKL